MIVTSKVQVYSAELCREEVVILNKILHALQKQTSANDATYTLEDLVLSEDEWDTLCYMARLLKKEVA